jgi:flagellar protein FlbD
MLKLTRLNHQMVAINPDHISWVEATPDTTLSLINGEKLLVRESLEDLIQAVIQYRRLVRMVEPPPGDFMGPVEGDPPRLGGTLRMPHVSEFPRRSSLSPPRSSLSPRRGGDR